MPAAAAGVFHGEGRQLSFAESLHGRAHGGIIAREVNLDAHLIEAHERTHAHAPGQQRVDPVLGQILDGARQPPCWCARDGRVECPVTAPSSSSTMVYRSQ